jgi:hypothetical protein
MSREKAAGRPLPNETMSKQARRYVQWLDLAQRKGREDEQEFQDAKEASHARPKVPCLAGYYSQRFDLSDDGRWLVFPSKPLSSLSSTTFGLRFAQSMKKILQLTEEEHKRAA